MNKLKLVMSLTLIVAIVIFSSCHKEEDVIATGKISFSISAKQISGGRVSTISSVLISITDVNGKTIIDRKKLALYSFGDEYLSEPISLTKGDFKLTEFLVVDENDNVIYATPMEGSPLAYLVSDPLPIDFSISKDQTTKVVPEEIKVNGQSGTDFGYATFSLDIVNTIQFSIGVLAYSSVTDNFELTNSHLTITAAKDTLFTKDLGAMTNSIIVKDGYDNYTLTVTKSGYITNQETYTTSKLKAYVDAAPIVVTLLSEGLSNGLVAYYPFTGNAYDKTLNHLDGLVQGAVLTADRNGNENSAYYFNGNSYIEVKDTSLLNFNNNFTLAAWVNSSAFKTYGNRIIDKSVGSQGDGFLLDTYSQDMQGNKIRMMCGGNGWYYLSPTALETNKWYFVVATYSSGAGKIYINGELNMQNTSNATSITTSTTPMRFGFDTGVRTGPDFDDSLVGMLDDIRIYSRVLSDEEITQLYKIVN